ncbi:SpoIID/LytB domain-containing protein [bacterium]|nr:SpoIID/LytB domain-containing protein [bacterium]
MKKIIILCILASLVSFPAQARKKAKALEVASLETTPPPNTAVALSPLETKKAKSKVDPNEPKIRVKLGGRRHGIKTIPIETYLAGVIGNEMNRNWPREALKAQTVAARSYALHQMDQAKKDGRNYDIVTTQADQVFRMKDIKNAYLKSVVDETRGIVLYKNDEVVEAFYSSTCGGKTRSARMASLSYKDYCQNVSTDSYCRYSPHRHWSYTISAFDLGEKLAKKTDTAVGTIKTLKVTKKDSKSGYVQKLVYKGENGSFEVNSSLIRGALGYMNIKSHRYTVKKTGDSFYFSGYGFGHGVGMCQFGAKEMASENKTYDAILAKYYPNVELKKLY